MAFACLPSINLHPSRLDDLLPAGARRWLAQLGVRSPAWQQLHRLWSADISRSKALPALTDLADPALVLALLPQASWHTLQLRVGASILAPRIRRCIGRAQVAVLRDALGDGLYEYALRDAPTLPPGLQALTQANLDDVPAQCLSLGEACMARALQAASPPVASRAHLRLPASALHAAAQPAWTELTPQAALSLCTALIQETDPTWLSSFPATR